MVKDEATDEELRRESKEGDACVTWVLREDEEEENLEEKEEEKGEEEEEEEAEEEEEEGEEKEDPKSYLLASIDPRRKL